MDTDAAIRAMMALNPGMSRDEALRTIRATVSALSRPTTLYMSKSQIEELKRLDTAPTHQPKSVRGFGSHSVGTYRGPQRRRERGRR